MAKKCLNAETNTAKEMQFYTQMRNEQWFSLTILLEVLQGHIQ